MIINANDIGKTTTCEAANCPEDASLWGLCARHAKQRDAGVHVQIHTNPEPGQNVLWCPNCKKDLPDEAFTQKTSVGGRPTNRRNRHWICRACDNRRRANQRRARA